MPKPSELSQEAFGLLLHWLGENDEASGAKYEDVHRRLVRYFAFKGCRTPEDLADEVVDRVARKLNSGELVPGRLDDPIPVVYGFAKYVYLEYIRALSKESVLHPFPISDHPDVERQHQCLDRCMERLIEPDRNLLLHYYRYLPGQKLQHRKSIAEQMQVAPNALRIRVCRLRSIIKECVMRCVQSRNPAWVQ
jgi:hypothetical protein